ncbi:cytochrome P450 family protein [Streptomyces fragilis]|uniref:Cytochrome P450 n=1 Tax=Streptomyces fragilis TaxID=67301 RepID=A0ABV2YLR3_9ACTN|nr:cytochrome P450 [Streptomyces fragilis]
MAEPEALSCPFSGAETGAGAETGTGTVDITALGDTAHEQNARLREAGPATRVALPQGVEAWVVPHYATLRDLLADPRVGKHPSHWSALAEGRVPADWPMINFVVVPGLLTSDGADHRRLRNLLGQAFTPRRVERLRPRVEALVSGLLDRLARHPAGEVVDLRPEFCMPLPIQVICELTGLPRDRWDRMHELSNGIVGAGTGPGRPDMATVQRDAFALLADLVDLRTREPGDDLTTALIAAREADGSRLSAQELVGTLLQLLVAGHETTINLMGNAIRALLTHPDQLALLRSGEAPWSAVTEETQRWDSPVNHFPLRYALEDFEVGGTLIRKGEAVLASYASAGRDEREYGESGAVFDLGRPAFRHLSFGHGPHFCIGAPLARLEVEVALEGLFTRFPGIRPAGGDDLPRRPGLVSNAVTEVPVFLTT